jgi:hypothetical protein
VLITEFAWLNEYGFSGSMMSRLERGEDGGGAERRSQSGGNESQANQVTANRKPAIIMIREQGGIETTV